MICGWIFQTADSNNGGFSQKLGSQSHGRWNDLDSLGLPHVAGNVEEN